MAEKGGIRQIVYERIGILLSLSAAALRKGNEKRAKRYVFLARKLSTRYNCRLSPLERSKFCKGCGLPLVPGINAKVRLRKKAKAVEYICSCGRIVKMKYGKK
ncbi:Ribonuclease P protein component 4 [uncultured archaeon]|nr:Ribonuclease P protein component 4 [uncultured archaeon]